MFKGSRHQKSLGHKLSHRLHVDKSFPNLLLTMEKDCCLTLRRRVRCTVKPKQCSLAKSKSQVWTVLNVKGFSWIEQSHWPIINATVVSPNFSENIVELGIISIYCIPIEQNCLGFCLSSHCGMAKMLPLPVLKVVCQELYVIFRAYQTVLAVLTFAFIHTYYIHIAYNYSSKT